MTFSELLLLIILVTHWLADFVFQSDEIAKNKGTNINILFEHAFYYTISWIPLLIILSFLLNNVEIFLFLPITFLSHALIDFYTSKANKDLHSSGNIHGFFVSIGLDQVLHYVQLYLTFKLLL